MPAGWQKAVTWPAEDQQLATLLQTGVFHDIADTMVRFAVSKASPMNGHQGLTILAG